MNPESRSYSPEEREAIERLRPVWFETVVGLGGNAEFLEETFGDLVQKYRAGSARAYHNILHIDRMVTIVRKFTHLAKRPHELQAAIFGHDSVYNAGSPTNEAESADVTVEILQKLGVSQDSIDETRRLIMISKDHKTTDGDVDGQIMIDGDYEILGSPPPIYRWYSTGIYAENVGSGKVSVGDYKIGRGRYLGGWLRQIEENSLFHTPEIRDTLQPQAFQNISNELKLIENL